MDEVIRRGSGEALDPAHEGVDKNLSILVEGVAIDAVVEGANLGLGDKASISVEEVGTSGVMGKDDSGYNAELNEGPEGIEGKDMHDQETSNGSNNFTDQKVLESVVAIESVQTDCVDGENRKLEVKVNESGLSKVPLKAPKGASETDKNSCVIDIKCSSRKGCSENLESERICRICHLASGRLSDATDLDAANGAANTDLIQLGCACKDELGIAHIHCAEAWFKLKGNRLCEICGEIAENVLGVADNGFMQEWNERRRFFDNDDDSSRRFCGCWRGQPFCNLLMACLVIAFVLPWFFRVQMF